MIRHRVLHLVALCIALSLAACGGTAGTVRGVSLGDEVEAPFASARTYSSRPSDGGTVGDARAASARAGLERAVGAASQRLTPDGRLALLAGYLGERIGQGATLPPPEVIQFFATRLGLPEVTPHTLLVGVPDPAALEASVADAVAQYLRRQRYDAFGLAVTERQGLSLVVIALASRPFTMDDVPRTLAAPGSLTVRGSLSGVYQQPTFEVRGPGGAVSRQPAGAGPEFQVALDLGVEGEHEVRLFGVGGAGSALLARFSVYVGVEPPDTLRLGGEAVADATDDVAGVTALLLARTNDLRAAAGLPAVDLHPGLSEVARLHSVDMAEHHFLAHQSETTGSPADRLRRANLASGLVLENVLEGRDARGIAQAVESTPQHRANVLHRDVTHVGLGVAERSEGGRHVFVVTQMFFKITPEIDTRGAPAELLERLNRARAARGAPAVDHEPNLDASAQEAAEGFLADPTLSQDDVMGDATGRLRRFAIAYRRVGGVLAAVSSLDEAATLEPTFDPAVRYVGIGVAQGNRPDLPPNAIVVVYILAWAR